jgi:hypothetical protein
MYMWDQLIIFEQVAGYNTGIFCKYNYIFTIIIIEALRANSF